MAKDQFKTFVDRNRETFESYSQDYDQIWLKIAPQLTPGRARFKAYWVAAAAVVILIISFVAWQLPFGKELPLELAEADTHYQPMITAKMKVIQTHHQEIDAIVWEDLQILDNIYEELKLDLKERADSDEVMQAIIENYRIKLDILDQILNEIEAKDDDKQQEQRDA